MSEARKSILASVRQALIQGQRRSAPSRQGIIERTKNPGFSIQPKIGDDLVEIYCQKHKAVHGTVDLLNRSSDVAEGLQRYLTRYNLDSELVAGGGPILDNVRWPSSWKVHRRSAEKRDRVVVSEAFAAVAETGTLVFLRTNESPTSHLFLAEDHLVILDIENIVKYQEDLWSVLRSTQPDWPRAVNLVTGPSKTADVEQTIEYGAHGPRRVHVLAVGLDS